MRNEYGGLLGRAGALPGLQGSERLRSSAGGELWRSTAKCSLAVLRGLRALLYEVELLMVPLSCAGCDAPDQEMCQECFANMCGEPSIVADDLVTVFGAVAFVGSNRKAIARWKDHARGGVTPFVTRAAELSAQGLLDRLIEMLFEDSARGVSDSARAVSIGIIPMPSSSKSLRERGFVPAYEIARGVLKAIECDTLLEGVNATHPITAKVISGINVGNKKTDQTRFGAKGRRKNVSGKFQLNNNLVAQCKNMDILLIADDVVTTGASIHELSKALKKATGTKVAGFCLFVTPKTMPLAKSGQKLKIQPQPK